MVHKGGRGRGGQKFPQGLWMTPNMSSKKLTCNKKILYKYLKKYLGCVTYTRGQKVTHPISKVLQ